MTPSFLQLCTVAMLSVSAYFLLGLVVLRRTIIAKMYALQPNIQNQIKTTDFELANG